MESLAPLCVDGSPIINDGAVAACALRRFGGGAGDVEIADEVEDSPAISTSRSMAALRFSSSRSCLVRSPVISTVAVV